MPPEFHSLLICRNAAHNSIQPGSDLSKLNLKFNNGEWKYKSATGLNYEVLWLLLSIFEEFQFAVLIPSRCRSSNSQYLHKSPILNLNGNCYVGCCCSKTNFWCNQVNEFTINNLSAWHESSHYILIYLLGLMTAEQQWQSVNSQFVIQERYWKSQNAHTSDFLFPLCARLLTLRCINQ